MNKKILILKIISIVMTIIAIRGIIFIFTDTEFDYAGLPITLIYIILCLFILITLYILWLAFIKKLK